MVLTERQKAVLSQVVRDFVLTGEPVSSGSVLKGSALKVSSATVRNTMSELETLGLLLQPHTSAGRIPTALGLRLHVEQLHQQPNPAKLDRDEATRLADGVNQLAQTGMEDAARQVGGLLSQVASLTSLVSLSSLHLIRLCDIHLSPLTNRRVLVVLVTDDDRVHHRVVQMEVAVDPIMLQNMQNYLAHLVVGLTLDQVRQRVRRELQAAEREYDAMITVALTIGQEALDIARPELFVEGKLRFFDHAEFAADTNRLRDMLRLLEEKEQVLSLLDRLCNSRRPVVLIGSELEWDMGDDVSLIVCGYARHGEQLGLLGLIGPARVDYDRIIPLIAYTARLLTQALDERG